MTRRMLFNRCHTPALVFLGVVGTLSLDAESQASGQALLGQALRTIGFLPMPETSLERTIIDPAIITLKPRAPELSAHELDRHIAAAATEHGVSRQLIRAVIEAESQFDPLALSARGACGLMQLMPGTAARFGVRDCFDARENIHGGTRFLKILLARYQGSVSLSMAAYNAGEGAVARHRGIPPYRQTRAYVRKVERLLAGASPVRRTDS